MSEAREPQPDLVRLKPGEWDPFIRSDLGPQLVVAGPGGGKTEFLVRRVCSLLEAGVPPRQLVVLSFSRRSAADLEQRIASQLAPDVPPVRATTFHSLGFRILEHLGPLVFGWKSMPALLTGPEQVTFVGELLRSESASDWPEHLRLLLHNRSFSEEVTDFLLRCTERGLKSADVALLAGSRPDWTALPSFMDRYKEALQDAHRIDYSSLQGLAIDALNSHHAAPFLSEVTHVLVDEYQDTTISQVAFLKALAASTGNITVAADPYQSVFSFRGADLTNVATFPEKFLGVKTLVLDHSFRVPETILRAAERLTLGDLPGSAGKVTPSGPGGRVDVFGFDQHTHEAEWIAGEIHRTHLSEGVPFENMAVLLRTKQRVLPELSRALQRRNIPHNKPNLLLNDQAGVKFIRDITLLAANKQSPSETLQTVRRLLLGPFFGVSIGAEREISRSVAANPPAIAAILEAALPDSSALAELLRDPDWATKSQASSGFWSVWNHLPQIADQVASGDPHGLIPAMSSLAQVLDHLAEREPTATLSEYFTSADAGAFEADTLISFSDSTGDELVLTTLHQAKGLQFHSVFIADAVDGAFPDLRRRTSLLNTHELTPSLRDPLAERQFRIQEETRLAYTAMTRASHRVVWTYTTAETNGVMGRPSRFLAQLGGADGGPTGHEVPVTSGEAEGLLRRTLADPGQPATRRLAALSVISRDQGSVLSDPASFAGARRKDPETSVVPTSQRFSPSQADRYESCPLRYSLERHLGLASQSTVYLSFGNLIHAIAEYVDRYIIDGGDETTSLTTALNRLEEVFEADEFGGTPWAKVWFDNGVTTLTKLYTQGPTQSYEVRFAEKDLQMEINGEIWRGRADRIDQSSDGHMRIVDYKTGTAVPTVADVAASTQLGFYQLAAQQDPVVAAQGPVQEAELWFPRTKAKGFTRRKFDPANLPKVEQHLADLATRIRSEQFEPIVGPSCGRCAFRSLCPQQPDGQGAFTK